MGFTRRHRSLSRRQQSRKDLLKSLAIKSASNRLYNGRRIGQGFVAAHVWREMTDGGLALRNHLTYSFIPNLVWLPAQVAKLSDREGSFVQTYLQAISVKVYRHVDVAPALQHVVNDAWSLLPEPTGIPEQGLPTTEELNFLEVTDAFVARRLASARSVANALDGIDKGDPPDWKVISTRYTDGLTLMDAQSLSSLREWLSKYIAVLDSASDGKDLQSLDHTGKTAQLSSDGNSVELES